MPFGDKLLENVTENIVVDGDGRSGLIMEIITSVLIAVVVTVFAYMSTGKIKKMMPMAAIRQGNKGERFKKKNIFGLCGRSWCATTFMAVNDVLSEIRKYFVLLVTSAVGVWLVVMPVNTINTLQSEEIAKWFALAESDFFIVDNNNFVKLQVQADKSRYTEYIDEIRKRLEDGGVEVKNVFMEVAFRLIARKDNNSYSSLAFQGLGTDTDDYFYDEGKPPVLKNEVAITHVVADKLKADIGDDIYIAVGGKEQKFIVTAIYQSMNNMGEGIHFPEETFLDYSSVSGIFGVQVLLNDESREKYGEGLHGKLKSIIPEAKIQSTGEFIDSTIGGISERIKSLKILILVVVLIINILVVVLMQKMYFLREQGEMGMLKAVGFSNSAIISWQSKRVMLVLFFGILIGTVTGTPFSQVTSGQVFKMMGASRITFQVNVVEVYLIYPVTIFIFAVLACVITMLRVRKLSPQKINEAE